MSMTLSDDELQATYAQKPGANPAALKEKCAKAPVALGCILRFPRAMKEIARVSEYGCGKYKVPLGDMSYLDLNGAETMFLEAEGRHMIDEALQGPVNEQDGGLYHKAQKAWNALADLEVFLRNMEKNDG